MIYGYCRVSRSHQNEMNQHFEIEQFASSQNLTIDAWIEEKVSSREPLTRRKLGKLLHDIKEGDILITTELSRIGRSLMEVMSILQMCLEHNCQVWTLKENYRLGQDLQSKVLAFAFGLSAEIERSLIQSRTIEALARLKAQGIKLGRPSGTYNQELKLKRQINIVAHYLKIGYKKARIARLMGVNRITIYRFLARQEIRESIDMLILSEEQNSLNTTANSQ